MAVPPSTDVVPTLPVDPGPRPTIALAPPPDAVGDALARAHAWRRAGVAAVVTVAPGEVLAECTALLAAAAAGGASEVHVSLVAPEVRTRPLRAAAAAGVDLAAALTGEPVLARVHGSLTREPAFGARRLAWFPRPIGPHHAAGIPSALPVVLPVSLPGIALVRTYLAMPTWLAESAQLAAAAAARIGPVRRRLAAVAVAERARARTGRYAVVAEAFGPAGVARVWVTGADVGRVGRRVTAEVAAALPAAASGVHTAGALVGPRVLLDALAADATCRWSVIRPPDSAA